MKKYTIEQAIADAFAEADRKIAQGKLINASDDDYDWNDENNFIDGDPESLYSLLSLYGQWLEHPEDKFKLEKALWKKYPNYA